MRNTTSTRPWRRLAGLAIAVLLTGLLTACATTQSPSTQLSDSAIATKVKAKLTGDPEINPFNVDVDVDEGVVRLSGKVADWQTRAEAEKLAVNTRGVKYVENDLEIGKTTFGQRVSDATLTTKVKAKLTGDPEINPFNINVDTEDGVVTLLGRVPTQSDRDEAERLARNTKGVRDVDNRLKVGKTGSG